MRRNYVRAFTLVEIMIVIMIIAILTAIAVPNFIRARELSRRDSCIANLKQIDSAKEQWAMDFKAAAGAPVLMSDLAGTYIKVPSTGPSCPAAGIYTVNNVGVNPTCSLAGAEGHVLP
jgi:prepilin-type N-terminal cleavage/methylation domain-containing protein